MRNVVVFSLFIIALIACQSEVLNDATSPLPSEPMDAFTEDASPTTSPVASIETLGTTDESSHPSSPPTATVNAIEVIPTGSLLISTSEWIVFESEIRQVLQIFIMDVNQLEPIALTHGDLNFTDPLWSPNGQKILFASYRQRAPVTEDIWVMNADGTEQLNLTHDFAYNSYGGWSPDGNKVVFSSEPERDGNTEIYVINADGSHRVRLTENSATDIHPTWSPNGEKIGFISDRDGSQDVYTMNIDGSDVTRLTQNIGGARTPQWSPDGQQIAFVTDNAVWIMNEDGSDQHKVSGNIDAFSLANWSPDGQALAFSGKASLDLHRNIYLVRMHDGELVRLTDDLEEYWGDAAWSPDGTRLIISGGAYLAQQDLYLVTLDELNLLRLTNNLGFECCADWQPFSP